MPLTSPKTTGLILGILIPILIISLLTTLIYRYQRRTHASKPSSNADSENPNSPTRRFIISPSTPDYGPGYDDTLPQGTDTVRRQTGQPQTFTSWIRRSGAEEDEGDNGEGSGEGSGSGSGSGGMMGRGERWPSLEHGPGPVIINSPTTVRPSPPASSTTHATNEEAKGEDVEEIPKVKETTRKRSIDESSLREAVLGVDKKEDKVERKASSMEIKKVEGEEKKEAGEARKTRGYSGAWP